ncbi:Dephospho-CoA kinase [Hyella patelloides LEGE 07179]|uniref:Dephospho-CoA kinase n=1 Tax=Hyella patelloides LEGE 07179 TaxID=945734 RepID=A0A563W0G2_9CYAN|nr:dephospho-CoA kinase [Hyella patelloides]VEP17171.1 Dephospho-CoA kinase [Hyella patelloides LEGE 07179]
MRIIGLTGGIATGKSTVSDYLSSKYNLPVLDADVYAKEAVAKDSPILQEIFTHFGNHLRLQDGTLNRLALGNLIFSNSEAKQWLESKIHPYVRDRFSQELANIKSNMVVLAIPLLFEANLTHLVTEIWVVSCNRENQLARLQKRNNLTLEQAQNRIKSQLPLKEKVAQADFVLENDSTLQHLYQQCDAILNKPLKSC